jgi:hypothetical protein
MSAARGSFMSADFVCVLGYINMSGRGILLAAVERKREREKSKIFSTTTYVDLEKNLVIK